jgi:dolichol-phosphate mannosyltransferase
MAGRLGTSNVIEAGPRSVRKADAPSQPAELSIIVPTFNEAANVPVLIERLKSAMGGFAWEVLFVDDDSADGTAKAVAAQALDDGRVRCLRRIGRRGLAGASIEGMLASCAPFVAVMDGDLQHDEAILPRMLEALRGGADLAIGSRYADGGQSADGFSKLRQKASNLATSLAHMLLKADVSDPMSGFFMIRRDVVDGLAPRLSSQGFKVLLDLIATSRGPLKIVEVPYQFRERLAGESKLDSLVAMDFLGLLLSKLTADWLSVRFLMFAMVGLSGLAVQLFSLYTIGSLGPIDFNTAQLVSTFIAMTWNFAVNNQLTYRDQRLRGLAALRGLLLFYMIGSVGIVANVGIAQWIHKANPVWWVAGAAGAIMGLVFNYAATSALTWRQR